MKILITGSSGFIGSHLVPMLKKEHQIYHLDNDLRDHLKVREEVSYINPDIIVHLAARTEVEQSFYEQVTFSDINYTGTVNLIEAARNCKNLKNFVFASTMEVYGWQPISDEIKINGKPEKHVAFDENTQPNPNAPYAVAKYGCEKYLQYAHRSYGMPFTAIRQTNCYGRKDNDFFVTEQIITQMLHSINSGSNELQINLGYSEPFRNFIYIDDMLEAWHAVISSPEKCNDGKIFTIGPDQPIKISDYANIISEKLDWHGTINWDTKPHRPGEIYWLNSNHNLITETLGWKPKTALSDGLDKTIAYWKENL